MATPECPAQSAAKTLPYDLAADWAGRWYCHNHLPPVINSHYITRFANMFLAFFFALNEDLN